MRAACAGALARLHGDERGTISILTVFAVLLLTMLLGMVMNVGRHADGKIRMQNAADAAAYSGGVVLARGMNTLAFTNHLLCDVFALTAFMREARDRNAARYVPEILDAWEEVAPRFRGSDFPKFEALGPAIEAKVPRERELLRAYVVWAAATSVHVLPLCEEILANRWIPEYQRAVLLATPDVAQAAARETAYRHGRPERGRGPMLGVLWRTNGEIVAGADPPMARVLPVVDAVLDALPGGDRYFEDARRQRAETAQHHLDRWNNETMYFFDREAKMGQFSALWRSFTCGYLRQLLNEEYPSTNMPMVIRTPRRDIADGTSHLAEEFTFLSVVYWGALPETFPGVFRNPLDHDGLAYAEVRMFLPKRRLVWLRHWPSAISPIGGVPGEFPELPDADEPDEPADGSEGHWYVGREPHIPTHWNLMNQNWTVHLVPATQPVLPVILQTPPPVPEFYAGGYRLPDLGALTAADIARISPH